MNPLAPTKLRYCNATCQHDHWRRGHKQMCKKIHRGGNAEQYNADKKYKEAVAVAFEASAMIMARWLSPHWAHETHAGIQWTTTGVLRVTYTLHRETNTSGTPRDAGARY